MRTYSRLFLLSVCLLVIGLMVTASGETKRYKVKWDMGFVPQKSKVIHTFYLKNSSDTAMTIEKIKAGCSCTAVPKIEGAVAPGDSVAIPVTFSSGRYHYRVQKTTVVTTVNPEMEKAYLSFLAQVIDDRDTTEFMEIAPRSLSWNIKSGQMKFEDQAVQFSNRHDDTVTVRVVEFPEKQFTWELPDTTLIPGESATFHVHPRNNQTLPTNQVYSATLEFAGRWPIRATIPLEIE